MKRLLIVAVCLALSSPAFAEKTRRVPRQSPTGAPATVTINGNPLTIVVGNDTSMQVYNANVPGTGQFYPPDCGVGETADSGVFFTAGSGGVVGPDFDNHPCGSASNTYTAWTPVSMTPVTGTGTAGDPFTVVIVVSAGGLNMTETLTYVNGASTAYITLAFPPAPLVAPAGLGGAVFVGADIYLADNDDGFSLAGPIAAGGRAADVNCAQLQYTIRWLGTTPAAQWTATDYGDVWDQISAGALNNSVNPTCIDNGAALQWVVAGGGTTINTGVSFEGQAVPVGADVPTLSTVGLAALVALLALVGYVLARKASPGA
jgi:hypothetical protein